jgi:hypothetical protein
MNVQTLWYVIAYIPLGIGCLAMLLLLCMAVQDIYWLLKNRE